MGRGDALGWGGFPGNGGMAVLSRLPIDAGAARSFARAALGRRCPGRELPRRPDGSPFPDAARRRRCGCRRGRTGTCRCCCRTAGGCTCSPSNPTPPLFDGAEGFNRRRNRDEVRFWSVYLDGAALPRRPGRTAGPPDGPLVVLGNLNLDPLDGAGERGGDGARCSRIRGCRTRGRRAPAARRRRATGVNGGHDGDPALDTADWRDDGGPGNLRVDYVLPSAELDGRRRRGVLAGAGRAAGRGGAGGVRPPAGLGGRRAARRPLTPRGIPTNFKSMKRIDAILRRASAKVPRIAGS